MENLLGRQLNYTVHTSVYEGPLDLLLSLIERAELDITALSLASVTDSYLSYINGLEQVNPDEISAFLLIAARLLQIKCEALLPRPPARQRPWVISTRTKTNRSVLPSTLSEMIRETWFTTRGIKAAICRMACWKFSAGSMIRSKSKESGWNRPK